MPAFAGMYSSDLKIVPQKEHFSFCRILYCVFDVIQPYCLRGVIRTNMPENSLRMTSQVTTTMYYDFRALSLKGRLSTN